MTAFPAANTLDNSRKQSMHLQPVLSQESTPRTVRSGTRTRPGLALVLALAMSLAAGGCAVTRGQETVGAYIDDAAITTAVKARMVDNTAVDAGAIKVETLNGTVMLSGFAKNTAERGMAETLTWKVNGVKAVRNEIAVRP
jgi:hyperosmotically inducible periplasmic protein